MCSGPEQDVSVCAQLLSHVQLFATPWTVAHQASLSVAFPSKNTGVGCHFLFPRDLPNPGTVPSSLASHTLAGRFFTPQTLGKPTKQDTRDKTEKKTEMTSPPQNLQPNKGDIQTKPRPL